MLVMEMSNKKQQIPAIRFNGFTDAWEQRKFSDLIQTMRGGASIAPDDYKDNGVATVPKGAINSTGIADLSGSKYVSKEFFEKNKNSSVYSDELVTSLRDLVPSAPNMGRIVKLEGKDKRYLMPQGVYNLILLDEVDENFLISFSNTSKFRRIISQEKNGSTQVHIRNSEYLGISIIIPDSEEQNKIGSFFKQLDATIALHQRKLEKSKALKSAYLSDMFPAEGDRKPKRRFAGFTDDWEQRKLKELTEVITKGTTPKDKSGKGSINFVKVENINKSSGEIDIKSKITENEHEGYLKRSQLKDGDILFSIAGTLGRTAIVKKELLPANTNQALAIIRLDEGDKNYITTFLNGRAAEDFIKKNPTVGAQPNLSLEQVGNLLIEIPSLEEQTKIGSFFKQLDDTIALHQHKLEKLKNIKQAYLNELFV